MAIQRSPHDKQNPFAQINKLGLADPEISWGAKGLWAYLLSLPNDWNISVAHLCKIYPDKGGGETAIYSYLNELIEAGYCERYKKKGEKGQFGETDYLICEFKKCLPRPAQPDVAAPRVVETPHTNNICTNKEEQQQGVVVFSCLQDRKDLTDEEKSALMKFPEERVILALKFAETETPKEKLIQMLVWHCKQKIPPIPSEKSKCSASQNKQLAQSYASNYESSTHTIEILSSSVEIVSRGPHAPFCIDYTETKFKEILEHNLKKCGFYKKKNTRYDSKGNIID